MGLSVQKECGAKISLLTVINSYYKPSIKYEKGINVITTIE
jgi:hypothetical protein